MAMMTARTREAVLRDFTCKYLHNFMEMIGVLTYIKIIGDFYSTFFIGNILTKRKLNIKSM